MKSFDFFQSSVIESINEGKLKEYFFTIVEDYLNKITAEDLKEIVFKSGFQPTLNDSDELSNFSTNDPDINEKLKIINWGKNCKEFILQSAISFIGEYSDFIFDHKNMNKKNFWIPVDKIANFYEFCYHSRIKWIYDIQQQRIKYTFGEKKKRQLSVKSSGSYYTPKIFSDFMAKFSISQIAKQKISDIKNILGEIDNKTNKISMNNEIIIDINERIKKILKILPIRVIDLTVGTGNFLHSALNPLVQYLKEVRSLFFEFFNSENNALNNIGDLLYKFSSIFSYNLNEIQINQKIVRYIIENCVYGIDLDKKAVIISKMLLKLEIFEKLGIFFPKSIDIKNILCRNAIISSQFPRNDKKFMNGIKKYNGIIWSDTFPEIFIHDQHNNKIHSKQKQWGFDIVIGNPPWEILKPNDREFFRNYVKDFQDLSRKKQDSVKNSVLNQDPEILKYYNRYIHDITDQIDFINNYNLYNYQSAVIKGKKETGDPQLYKLILETAFSITKPKGGIISYLIQHNLLGSKGCTGLRKLLLSNGDFEGIWEFYNKSDGIIVFPNIDLKQRFIIIQYRKREQNSSITTPIVVNQESVIYYKRCEKIADLNKTFENFQKNTKEFYEKFSGEELQLFTFSSEAEKKAFLKLLSFPKVSEGLLWRNEQFIIKFSQDLHVTRDRHEIITGIEFENLKKHNKNLRKIPIFGGKNIGSYYTNSKHSNIHDSDVKYFKKSEDKRSEYNRGAKKRIFEENLDSQQIANDCLVCRNILPNSAKRLIFSIIPNDVLINNSCTRIIIKKILKNGANIEKFGRYNSDLDNNEELILFLISIFNSLIIEFYVKTFLTGINLNYYILDRIPLYSYDSIDQDSKSELIQKRIQDIVKDAKFLVSNPPNTSEWVLKYEEIEVNLAKLFNLDRDEFSAILNTINFNKLNKTAFCGIKPFFNLNKERILSLYEK